MDREVSNYGGRPLKRCSEFARTIMVFAHRRNMRTLIETLGNHATISIVLEGCPYRKDEYIPAPPSGHSALF